MLNWTIAVLFGRACLIKSLKYNELCLEEIKDRIRPSVEVRWHGRQHGEPVNFCATCDQEVFNILYTKQQLVPPGGLSDADTNISGHFITVDERVCL